MVNLTHCTFVCTRCSGLLLSLGAGVRIKSLSASTFSPDDIDTLSRGGNAAGRRKLLATYLPTARAHPRALDDDATIVAFMRDVYVNRLWEETSVSSLAPAASQLPVSAAEEDSIWGSVVSANSVAPLSAPSFAAPPPPHRRQKLSVVMSTTARSVSTAVQKSAGGAGSLSVDDLLTLDFGASFVPAQAPAPTPTNGGSEVAAVPVAEAYETSPSEAVVVVDRQDAVQSVITSVDSVKEKTTAAIEVSRDTPVDMLSFEDVDVAQVKSSAESISHAVLPSGPVDLLFGNDQLSALEPPLQFSSIPFSGANTNRATDFRPLDSKFIEDFEPLVGGEGKDGNGMGSLLDLALSSSNTKTNAGSTFDVIAADLRTLSFGESTKEKVAEISDVAREETNPVNTAEETKEAEFKIPGPLSSEVHSNGHSAWTTDESGHDGFATTGFRYDSSHVDGWGDSGIATSNFTIANEAEPESSVATSRSAFGHIDILDNPWG
ncbi:hypothetical protein HDU84_001886 [Entophlyctis sp. JEL0112]|nr:hypothetical protein HDU84_001886 [Entophlyctis sp. JEL0112]